MSQDLTGIYNVGEFYSRHYLEAVLGSNLKDIYKEWRARAKEDGIPNPAKKFARLQEPFFKAKHQASQETDPVERWRLARNFHVRVLETLGYEYNTEIELLPEGEELPLLLSQCRDDRPFLWVVDAPFPEEADEPALDTSPLPQQYPGYRAESSEGPSGGGLAVAERPEVKTLEASWRELLDGPIFKQENPPRWVLFMGGDDLLLIDGYKWGQGKYLRFELGDLFRRQSKDAIRAATALLHQEVLNPEDGVCRHDTLDEANHKHAYAVSTDLKYGAREAIELLGNEAIRYKREVSKEAVFSNEELAQQVIEECLPYLYRLLFLFYVEARGPGLGSWSQLIHQWHRHSAARTPYERRQSLVELDALAALALNLTAEELCTIYRVQFPILHHNERETFYDQRGMIVFTSNRGMPGVGLQRKEFEDIKKAQPGDELPEYATEYVPPFSRCDREEDMTLAYEVFQERLLQTNKSQIVEIGPCY